MIKETFPLLPASSGPVWFFLAIGVLLLGVVALFGSIVYSSRNTRCEVSPGELRIAGNIYGRRIPIEALSPDAAKVIDLRGDPALGISWRTNGVGLPGYGAGWFRLKNGEKALLFVTDPRRVLYLPTKRGYSLLVSPADPDGLLAAVRRAAS